MDQDNIILIIIIKIKNFILLINKNDLKIFLKKVHFLVKI